LLLNLERSEKVNQVQKSKGKWVEKWASGDHFSKSGVKKLGGRENKSLTEERE